MSHDAYLDPYRESQQQHGPAFEVTLWASLQSQQIRFRTMMQMCNLTHKRILDAGCSRGDFAAYLIKHHVHFDRYIGLDALGDVITFAAQRELPDCEFHVADFLAKPYALAMGKPDVVAISGSLNTMSNDQVHSVLTGAWQAAGQTLIFNFLSDRADIGPHEEAGPARRLGTLKLLDWAMGQTPQVAFRQDYFQRGHDATIMMCKAGGE